MQPFARPPSVVRPSLVFAPLVILVAFLLLSCVPASAFCGFYVAKADTDLFNQASKVVIVRDDERTVITMANDYRGAPSEFALVIPVPTFLEREQIHVGERAVIEHLDAYTAPRLVEYFDPDPCRRVDVLERSAPTAQLSGAGDGRRESSKSLGVTIEASYSVGEYEILILSAEESRGLETWLRENEYQVPRGAGKVLQSYIRRGMRFFVAKVDLDAQERLGFSYLRPLQIAFEWEKFMLPIRLGMLNADGPQELFVFLLTRSGRVETANYRTVKLPSDVELPLFVKDDFGDFYRAMFTEQVERERMKAVFLEYAWDMNWCDPCAADPLSQRELRQLGVFWVGDGPLPRQGSRPGIMPSPSRARDVFVTRLHLRYNDETFPDDLAFRETDDRTNFQGRYVLRHPWTGQASCAAGREYHRELAQRQDQQAENLARLTGWDIGEIRRRQGTPPAIPEDDEPWWKKIWGGEKEGD